MIDRALIKKYIGQSSVLWCSLALALFSFAWVRVWVVSLLDMNQFQTILDQFKDFEKFAPIEFTALLTYSGRVGMTFDEPIVILCTVVWCIARGSDVVSGELNRGTLEMLLSQPVSRTQLLGSHAVVSVVGLVLLCLMVWAGIGVGVYATTLEIETAPPSLTIPIINWQVPIPTDQAAVVEQVPMRNEVDVRAYGASVVHLFSFGFFILALATMVSSMDRYRWRTIGVVVGIYVLQLVVFGLGKAAESLNWLQSFTFFSCYKPQKMVSIVGESGLWGPWSLTTSVEGMQLPPLAYPLILVGCGIAFYVSAKIYFERRDLPAPL